jgi:hypothetical protein
MTEKSSQTVLLSVLDNYGGHPFDQLFDVVFPCYGVNDVIGAWELAETVAMVIWGGADISPTIYGQKPNMRCGQGENLSERDKVEVAVAYKAMELQIPIIGICRGAQLVCALAGGSLVQHVDGHAGGYHPILTSDGETVNCPSLHHQMMYPWFTKEGAPVEHEMLAWSPKPRSKVYLGEPDEESDDFEGRSIILPGHEPEVVWFPKTKSLAIQSHPEFIHDLKHPFIAYTNKLIRRYILPDVH